MSDNHELRGPDLTIGFAQHELDDGEILLGHVGNEEVMVVRCGSSYLAVGAHCTHYHGPLAEGLVVEDTIRCPWHHACFDLRTGEALRAPAFDALSCWEVELREEKVFVHGKRKRLQPHKKSATASDTPNKVIIVGGGAAGFAAAEMLRREGYQGGLVMLSQEDAAPVDRPNLSKDYLAGTAPADWMPLRPDSFYAEHRIDLRLQATVEKIDTRTREVALADGTRFPYDRLLLATGAEPVRLAIPGAHHPHVCVLRSFSDCRAIIALAGSARRVVIIGASFIGLEVAAALRSRDLEVHVVAPEQRPMERILGPEMGDFVRALHEAHGVVFHLGETAREIETGWVALSNGNMLKADLVVVGIGVRPRTELAETAGLALDRGVLVNPQLQTSVPEIFAAGDIARWPDPHSGEKIRVEHWVVAERQGQTAARNMLGAAKAFADVPFFWSQHYDVPINYVGHAEVWDELAIEGDVPGKDCLLRFQRRGRTLAVASIFRDIENLRAELAFERASVGSVQ